MPNKRKRKGKAATSNKKAKMSPLPEESLRLQPTASCSSTATTVALALYPPEGPSPPPVMDNVEKPARMSRASRAAASLKKLLTKGQKAVDREGRKIKKECQKSVIGLQLAKIKDSSTTAPLPEEPSTTSAAAKDAKASTYAAQYPWLQPVNDGSGRLWYDVKKMWESAAAAQVAVKAGKGTATSLTDQAIGFVTCHGGIPIPDELCLKCGSQICKYDITPELPKPQQINTVQFAKWCCNMLCAAPVNFTELITEEVYNNSSVDLNRPLEELMNDPNLPPMDLEEALSTDWGQKLEEGELMFAASKFMFKEMEDSAEVLRRVLETSNANEAAEMEVAAAATAPEEVESEETEG